MLTNISNMFVDIDVLMYKDDDSIKCITNCANIANRVIPYEISLHNS